MDELRVRALEMARDRLASATEIQRVAKATSQEAAGWAFGQWELRSRGKAKFARAAEMLFVREALEQATHEAVAAYHGRLFPGGDLVADLTVGIGADLIGVASRGPAIGFELDSERVEYAKHNTAVHGLGGEIYLADSTQATWNFEYAFADPARRVDSRRTLDPSEFSPNPIELAERMADLKLGVLKLSPLLPDLFLESLAPRLEFVSYGGECREVLAIMGSDAEPGRFAVQVETGERISAEFPPVEASTTMAYLYDADPSAVRAHALGTLCDQFELFTLGSANGYLTGDEEIRCPWLRTYRVLYTGKGDAKTTRKALKELDAEIFEIKQRGVKADLAKTKKELSAEGKLPVSLVLWPDRSSVRHSLVTRVE